MPECEQVGAGTVVDVAQHRIANEKDRPSGGGLSMWAAIVWMCRNQLGRRNLTDVQRTLLIGEAYRAQKMTQGAADGFRGNQYEKVVKHQNGVLPKDTSTAKVVAKEFGVGSSTVDRANWFLEGLDAAESVSSGFKDAVRSGAIKTPQSVVREIRNIPEAQLPAAIEAIKSGDIDTAKEIIQQSKPEPEGCSKNVSGRAAI